MQAVTGSGGTSVRLSDNMAPRVAFMVRGVESEGGTLYLTEGYRPTGRENPDRYVRFESQTSTGTSTQWFQVGRMDRGETSAIIPNADGSNLSRHSTGDAIDCNVPTSRDMQLRAKYAIQAGLVANVAGESWHFEALRAPTVNLDTEKGFLHSMDDKQQQDYYNRAKAHWEWFRDVHVWTYQAVTGLKALLAREAAAINPVELKAALLPVIRENLPASSNFTEDEVAEILADRLLQGGDKA